MSGSDVGLVRVSARAHALRADAVARHFPEGQTVADMARACGLDPHAPGLRATISTDRRSAVVPRGAWHLVRPRAGAFVEIAPVLRGAALAPLLQIIVQSAAGPLAKALGWGAIGQAALTVVGGVLVNALVRPPSQRNETIERDDPVYSISGSSNVIDRYGVYPSVFGRHRMFPKATARGYTEAEGEDVFFRGRWTFGHGPVALDDLRIGTTPITEFEDVEIEFLNVDQARTEAAIPGLAPMVTAWRSGAAPMQLYPDDISEEGYSVELAAETPVTRTSATRAREVEIDVTFAGLVDTSNNYKAPTSVEIAYRWRLPGAPSWTDAGSETWTGATTSDLRTTKRIVLPSEAEAGVEVQVERITPVSEEIAITHAAYLTAIRTVRSGQLPSHDGIAEIAIRVRASDQINGRLDQVNAVVQQLAPVWTGSAWSAAQPVRHPAWVFAQVLRGGAIRDPLPDARLDLAGLKAWADEEPHWTCDLVIDGPTTVAEVLDAIASTGRARRGMRDLRHGVVRDLPTGPVVAQFSPRNSWGFTGRRVFSRPLDAVRVRFRSERLDWEIDEVTVYADGKTAETATEIEVLDLTGVVVMADDEGLGNVWRLGRYFLAVAALRREEFELQSDLEHVRCQMGDKVRIVHDVPGFGVGQGRVKTVTAQGEHLASVSLDTVIDVEEGTPLRARLISEEGEDIAFGILAGTPYADADETVFPGGLFDPVLASKISVGDHIVLEEIETVAFEGIIRSVQHAGDLRARLTIIPAAPAVLTADTGTIPDYDPQITAPRNLFLGPPLPVVAALISDETVMREERDGSVVPRIAVRVGQSPSVDGPPAAHRLRWRRDVAGSAWTYGAAVAGTAREVLTDVVEEGLSYRVEIEAQDALGRARGWVAAGTITAAALTAVPPDVARLRAGVAGSLLNLAWDDGARPDLRQTELRFSPLTTGATWSASTALATVPWPGRAATVPARPGTYFAKWRDHGGRASDTAAAVVISSQLVTSVNVVEEVAHGPSWTGTLDAVEVIGGELVLEQTGGVYPGAGVFVSGTTVDLGQVYPCAISALIDAASTNDDQLVEDWGLVEGFGLVDVGDAGGWEVRAEYRTTTDDPAGSPSWSDWSEIDAGQVIGRAFQFRLSLASTVPSITPRIGEARFVVDMPDRIESAEDVTADAGGEAITFATPFRVVPSIQVTPLDAPQGAYFEITSRSRSGFSVRFFNSGGTGIAQAFDWIARGYGREAT
jgi:hypothetical protein